MGELGALITAWQDRRAAFGPRPSASWIGQRVGAQSRSTIKPWLTGESMPRPHHLRALAELIGVSYRTVLDAALFDAGYLEEREYRGNTAPMNDGQEPIGGRLSPRPPAQRGSVQPRPPGAADTSLS